MDNAIVVPLQGPQFMALTDPGAFIAAVLLSLQPGENPSTPWSIAREVQAIDTSNELAMAIAL